MNKRIIIGGVMAVLFLAAATVFVAAVQPFSASAAGQAQTGDTEDIEATQVGDAMYIEISRNLNGEELSGGVFITFENPDELPATDPDTRGVFAGLSGNTVTVGTGRIEVTVDVEQVNNEEPVTTANATYNGPEVDILFTDSTIFYEDTTEEPHIDREEIEAGELTITRTLQPGTADALGENMVIRAWGTMVDGQLVADIIVYEPIK